MLILCALLAAGALQFTDEPLPGVRVGPVTPFTGQPSTNFLQADLDEDGLDDLILPNLICFQRLGRFPEELRAPWPESATGGDADTFGAALYVRTSSLLRVFSRTEGRWNEFISQPLDWPSARMQPPARGTGEHPVQFRRFLHDIDGDNTPELVDLDGDGVHVFRLQNGRYEPAGVLDVLPSMTLAPAATQAIWPPENRRIVLPEQEMSCRLVVLRNALAIVTHADVAGALVYRRETIQLDAAEGGAFTESARQRTESAPLPAHVRPCQLNTDGGLDFAGGRWLLSESAPVPVPIYETWASLDGGVTFFIDRATTFQHFRPACSFVDFDGDGDLDLVSEATRLFEGGTRETINRYLTSTRLPHAIRVIAQDQGSFKNGPILPFEFDISLDSPPVSGGAMLARYQSGDLVNITGDFNGDGFRDVVVRDSATRLAIHLARGWSEIEREPAALISIPANGDFSVSDLNGDGLADLLLDWEEGESGSGAKYTVAYYTKGGAP